MDRRTFIGTVAGGLLAAPLVGEAQPTGKIYRVGLVFTTSPVSRDGRARSCPPPLQSVRAELRALGYVEGQNLILERRVGRGAVGTRG